MTGEESLHELIAGNQGFVAGQLTATADLTRQRDRLVESQAPIATIIACSDSRVPPELVFDQTLGRLFVVRIAGQVIDAAARSSLLFGVDVLKTPLLFVLGHTACGAVTAAVTAFNGGAIPDYADRFADGIRPAIERAQQQPGDLLANAIEANVALGVERLQTELLLTDAVRGGQLKIAGGIYELATGRVSVIA